MRPTNNTWHFHIPNMIYWGMDWLCPGYSGRIVFFRKNYFFYFYFFIVEVLGTQLKKYHGSLTIPLAIEQVKLNFSSQNVFIFSSGFFC